MYRPLSVGVQLPEIEREVRWAELRQMAITAEEIGFDSIWLGDHLLYRTDQGPRGPWEAWSMMAAIAAVTERVQIGPLVAATSFHNPTMLAKKAATVDEISNGRLILGLGAGWNRTEYDAFGFPFDHRASRFEEAFTIIRTLLREGAIDFAGDYYTAADCELVPRPRPGGPPLMVGSIGPRVLRATLPYVDMWNGWHSWYGNDPAGLPALMEQVDSVCREVGRDPAEVARTVAVMIEAPTGSGRLHGSFAHGESPPIGGSPDTIADALRTIAATGIDQVQLVVDPITNDSIEWLGGALAALDGQ
ncbi:MAG: LLM class flavin-dependent oxidoreductase [Actinomycetota bacterium]|nr:LLM class flavin-dependent oxidoreductase [Actinomycetota bacterium]